LSWTGLAWTVFRNMPRPIDYKDIADRTGMDDNEAQKCICRLVKAKCVRFVHGNARTGRYYEAIPGAELPPDQRGKHPNSKGALVKARLRKRASHPTSHVTAARLKP
jgi:hypothetical protein